MSLRDLLGKCVVCGVVPEEPSSVACNIHAGLPTHELVARTLASLPPVQPMCGKHQEVGCELCFTPTGGDAGLEAEVRTLRRIVSEMAARAEKAQAERDAAIAHDRQPYPTADAYENACAALNSRTTERDAGRRRIAEMGEANERLIDQRDALKAQVEELEKNKRAILDHASPVLLAERDAALASVAALRGGLEEATVDVEEGIPLERTMGWNKGADLSEKLVAKWRALLAAPNPGAGMVTAEEHEGVLTEASELMDKNSGLRRDLAKVTAERDVLANSTSLVRLEAFEQGAIRDADLIRTLRADLAQAQAERDGYRAALEARGEEMVRGAHVLARDILQAQAAAAEYRGALEQIDYDKTEHDTGGKPSCHFCLCPQPNHATTCVLAVLCGPPPGAALLAEMERHRRGIELVQGDKADLGASLREQDLKIAALLEAVAVARKCLFRLSPHEMGRCQACKWHLRHNGGHAPDCDLNNALEALAKVQP